MKHESKRSYFSVASTYLQNYIMPPVRSSGAMAGYAAGKVAGSAWKRYNPWRKGGRWGPKRFKGKARLTYRKPSREIKFHDLTITDAIVVNTGAIASVSCNLIQQGTGEDERIGRKCTIKSIEWRFTLSLPEQTNLALANDSLRIILYQDKQANGATAAVTDILEVASFLSFYNPVNQGRFRIFYDRTITLNATSGGGNGTALDVFAKAYQGTFSKRCHIPLEFSTTGGVITALRSNNVGVLLISDNGLLGFDSRMRINFTG